MRNQSITQRFWVWLSVDGKPQNVASVRRFSLTVAALVVGGYVAVAIIGSVI